MEQEHTTIELTEIAVKNTDKWVVKPYAQDDTLRHEHHFFELVYITGGETKHVWNGENSVLKAGDYFVVDYGSYHKYVDSRELTLINCLFLPEIINETFGAYRSFDELIRGCFIQYNKMYWGQTAVNHVFHDEDGTILKLFLGMQKEYEEKDFGYGDVFRFHLKEIMIRIMRSLIDPEKKIWQDTVIEELLLFVEKHYNEASILAAFCVNYHFSEPYISRKFRQTTGGTIREFIQKTRVEKSCELLAANQVSVAEIAAKVGYADVKFFYKIFRRWLHMSPGEYRKIVSRQGSM